MKYINEEGKRWKDLTSEQRIVIMNHPESKMYCIDGKFRTAHETGQTVFEFIDDNIYRCPEYKNTFDFVEKEKLLKGIYEAKGVKFPAWVEFNFCGKCVEREAIGVDADGYLHFWNEDYSNVTNCHPDLWRPIQPKQTYSVEELKKLSNLGVKKNG